MQKTVMGPLRAAPLASRSGYEAATTASIRIRDNLGGKGIQTPRVGVHRRAPGGTAVSSHLHVPAPVHRDGKAFFST